MNTIELTDAELAALVGLVLVGMASYHRIVNKPATPDVLNLLDAVSEKIRSASDQMTARRLREEQPKVMQ